ncbi:FAD/NAD(P)-binding protein [Jeongeupia wiesaeckerbachi]|uniref:FAD/NAD(P)-binding protein n=1 Tax=Jeongeupia wiesaeckerbachi TaxID=3051218 RepID=UPI003D804B23
MTPEHTNTNAPLHRIAIIGSGPRGLAVMERLAAILSQAHTDPLRLHIHLIDANQVGCGRIWRTDQPDWYLMNTVADEVSAFSGTADGGPARPGAGPSLALWWRDTDPGTYTGPNSYASRARYGRYMQFVFGSVVAALQGRAQLHQLTDTVLDIAEHLGGYRLALASGGSIDADRVVLVPGHSQPTPSGRDKAYADFAGAQPDLRYIQGDSAADMPLDDIPPGSNVGIIGLGLSFYDVMAALTLGRGGRFVETEGELHYLPSGREPVLLGGSRSSMLLLARGRNQKHANYRYEPAIFTMARAQSIRQAGPVDFAVQIVPLLLAEVNLVYYQTLIRQQQGEARAAAFRRAVEVQGLESVDAIRFFAAEYGQSETAPVDLDRIAHPFADRTFDHPDAFVRALLAEIDADLAHAEEGNVDSPLKAALDVIRDTRAIIRSLVDFGGLAPESHRGVFFDWYVPRSAFLAAGPPRFRVRQARALIKAGVLRIVGPAVEIRCEPASQRFVLASPHVQGSATAVSTLIDARIPSTNIGSDKAPLTQQLLRKGIWTSYVNRNGDAPFDTGGVAVSGSPYHPLDSNGVPNRQLYVLGIPTEHTRWFMQAGSSRPGFWTDFVLDADAIARDALAPVLITEPVAYPDAPESKPAYPNQRPVAVCPA